MSTDPTSTVEIVFDTRVISADEVEVPELGIASVVLTPAAGGALADTVHATAHVTTIVLLSYGDRLPPGEADSRTLLDLIALTQDFVARDAEMPRVVAELLDLGNAPLARARGAADVIVTPSMASRLVAQFADQPERRDVYFSLYAPGSASLRLVSVRPARTHGHDDHAGRGSRHGTRRVSSRSDGGTRGNSCSTPTRTQPSSSPTVTRSS